MDSVAHVYVTMTLKNIGTKLMKPFEEKEKTFKKHTMKDLNEKVLWSQKSVFYVENQLPITLMVFFVTVFQEKAGATTQKTFLNYVYMEKPTMTIEHAEA